MDYKKITKPRVMRSKILKTLSFIPDEPMLKFQYKIKAGRRLNLKNPKRFTEKLQWYKLYYRNPVMHQCVNKYEVREYIEGMGLEDTLVNIYGHYDIRDVDWDHLPDEFMIKTQHGGGGLSVILCHDKSEETKKEVTSKLAFSHTVTHSKRGGREWACCGIPTGVVVEELLVNRENPKGGINDYKLFCYYGHVKYIIVDVDRYIGHKRISYDRDWNNFYITSDCSASDREIERQENRDEMLSVTENLLEGFPYVRINLYSFDGKVYFREFTIYPWSEYVHHDSDELDYRFGKEFTFVKLGGYYLKVNKIHHNTFKYAEVA